MQAKIALYGVTLDCPNAADLAQFYGALAGLEVAFSSPEAASLAIEGGLTINLQAVDGYQAPKWPSQEAGQQFHLDFTVDDLEEAEAHAVSIGAKRAGEQPGEDKWRVMLDPAGHPFCLAKMA